MKIKVGDFLEVHSESDYFCQEVGTRYKAVQVRGGKVYWEGLFGGLDSLSIKVAVKRFKHVPHYKSLENK